MRAQSEVPSLRFVVSLVGRISVLDDAGQEVLTDADQVIEEHLDQVMEELDNLGAPDPSIELDGDRVEFTVMVAATNPLGAVSQASGLLRTAIHAAKGATPDWPTSAEDGAWAVQLVSVSSVPVESDRAAGELIDA
jgi:hypothetical protein